MGSEMCIRDSGSPSSLDFDPGDSVSLGGLDVNGTEVTLAAWVKADSFTGPNFDGRIISKADALAANRHVFMLATRIVNGTDAELQGRVRIGGQTATFRARSGVMVPGVWYHTAMVYDGSTAKLYLDCLLYTSPSPRDLSTSRMPSSA